MATNSADVRERPKLCPLCCGGSEPLFSKNGIPVLQCVSCRHRFADVGRAADHIQRTYDDDYFCGRSGGYADYLGNASLRVAQGRRYAHILRSYTVPGFMLSVGTATGHVMSGFLNGGWQGEGIEPNAKMAKFAREQLSLDVHESSLEAFQSNRTYDLVTLVQVLPHFVDVGGCVAKVAELTRPGGLCLVETWDRSSRIARWRGRHWHEYNPPSVLHWFDRLGVERLFSAHGMACLGRANITKWLTVGTARSMLAHQATSGDVVSKTAGLIGGMFPARLALPYLGDDLLWFIFRKGG